MLTYRLTVFPLCILAAGATGACAPPPAPAIPPAPIRMHWPDPAFEPSKQCRGNFELADLEGLLPRAQVAWWLPATRAVQLDSTRRCLVVSVEDTETGRLAELLLRGVAVPRRAVLLQLATGAE